MCTFDWVLFLEYLKIFLSWPPILAGTIIFVFILFKKEIRDYLKNLKIKLGDVEVSSHAPLPQTINPRVKAEDDASNSTADTYPVPLKGDPVAESDIKIVKVDPIKNETDNYPASLKGDPYAESEIKKAKEDPIKYVANFKDVCIQLGYERIHARIYGSQLRLLQELERNPDGKRLAELSHHFEEYRRLSGQPHYPYQERYMQFLVDSNLIAVDESPSDEFIVRNAFNPLYKITITGLEFYAYVQQNYPIGTFYKPY